MFTPDPSGLSITKKFNLKQILASAKQKYPVKVPVESRKCHVYAGDGSAGKTVKLNYGITP